MRTSKLTKPIKPQPELVQRTGEVFEAGVRYLSPGRSRMVVHFLITECGVTVEAAWSLAVEQFGTAQKRSFYGGPECTEIVVETVRKMV